MNSACFTETQKPRARIWWGTRMVVWIARRTAFARTWSAVYRDSRLATSVPPSVKRNCGEVGAVVNAEVLKRNDETLVERIPQPQLGGYATIEPGAADLPSARSGVAVSPRRIFGLK